MEQMILNGKDQVWILNVDVDVSNLTKTKMKVGTRVRSYPSSLSILHE